MRETVREDLNDHRGTRILEQGARIAVYLATLPPMGQLAAFSMMPEQFLGDFC